MVECQVIRKGWITIFTASLLSILGTVVYVWHKKFLLPPHLSSQSSYNIEIAISGNVLKSKAYAGWMNREKCGPMLPKDAICHATTEVDLNKLYYSSLVWGITPDAVAVSPHIHSLSTIEAWKSRGVEVFFYLRESSTRFPNVELFEGHAAAITYRMNTAEIPHLYTPSWPFHPNETSRIRTPVFENPGLSRTIRGVVIIASNCKATTNNRQKYVQFFMDRYPSSTQVNDSSMFSFDSLGKCMNNAPWPTNVRSKATVEAIRKYMFYFAFENSCTVDYVTEKVYNGLAAGVIPVYLGAPNIEEFVPPNSIIDASKFESLPELAEYIEKVSRSQTLYESYFKWKLNTTGLEAVYQRLHPYMSPYYCRMCLYAYGRTRLGYDKQWWNQKLQRWEPPPDVHPTNITSQ